MPLRLAAVLLLVPVLARADESKLPPGTGTLALRLEARGPTAMVTALAFSPDGETLYAAGFDKVVRVWQYDGAKKQFLRKLDPTSGLPLTFRVPLGPGLAGSLNALAVSPDGKWLAVGGYGLQRGLAGYREPGLVLSTTSLVDDSTRRDMGLLFVFASDDPRRVSLLRKHKGPIVALAFAAGDPATLASLAREEDGEKEVGVVRLWDVAKADEIARSPFLGTPKQGERPGLVAWRNSRRLCVAVALRQEPLQVWNVPAERWRKASREGSQWDDTLALLSPRADEDSFLFTASYRPNERAAHLQAWQVPPDETPVKDSDRGRVLAGGCAPRALALCPSESGRVDHAAVVLWYPPRDKEERHRYELGFVALGTDRIGEVKHLQLLWEGLPGLPVLAATPRGRFLAVAGSLDHSIRLFAIKDLPNGKAALLQPPLQSEGVPRSFVAFVKKGERLGLAVSGQRSALRSPLSAKHDWSDDDLVVDFSADRVQKWTADWVVARPNAADWSVEHRPGAPERFDVSHHGQRVQTIALKPGQMVTQYALLGSSPARVPLLAVAFREPGETELFLFDAEHGVELRRLVGHSGPVRALAFSPDGRLLASAGDDQTVCVWRLTDLDKLLGKQGMIRGLVVNDTDNGPRVTAVNRDELNKKNREELAGIGPGAAVEGMVVGSRRSFRNATAFYRAVWQLRPDPDHPVRIRIDGRDRQLVIDQGIDDRKPWVSLFLTRQGEWVAWSPRGRYDFSVPAAEDLIGWHKNTGEEKRPVDFQVARVYREPFYTPGLLGKLLGELTGRASPSPEGRAVLSVWIDELGLRPAQVDDKGRPILRRPPVTLAASVDNYDPERISFLRWQAGRDDWQEFTDDLGGTRKIDLSQRVRWTRGEHRIRVALLPFEADARETVEEKRVLFLPPAPEVIFAKDWLAQVRPGRAQNQPEFGFEALVQPAPGQEAVVTLELNGKKVDEWLIKGPVRRDERPNVRKTLTLAERPNKIVLVARNSGPLEPGYESREEVEKVFIVPYIPTPVPEVVVHAVGTAGAPREGESLVITERTVRIRGSIKAEKNLTVARLNGESLFQPGKKPDKSFSFDVPYTAKPRRPQTVEIVARAEGSELRTFKFDIDYQPPLPRFHLLAPLELLRIPADRRTVHLRGALIPPATEHTIEVRHNGRLVRHELQEDGRILTVDLTLKPGDNDVQIVVNRMESARLRAYVLQPPKVRPVPLPAQSKTSLIEVKAEVETPVDLPLLGARLTNDQYPGTIEQGKKDLTEKDGKAGRHVSLKDVPLKENVANKLRLWVQNGDGESVVEFTIKGPPPVVPKPAVALLSPLDDISVDRPAHPIEFKVDSEKPLRSVAILRPGRSLEKVPLAEGGKEFRVSLALRPGPNPFRVIADNEGGRSESVERVITYVPDTVFLHFAELVPAAGGGEKVRPGQDGRSFERVGSGALRLRGSVEWLKRRDDLRNQVWVRLRVNGFEQFPVPLDEPSSADGLRRTFDVPLRLNQERDNRVELEFDRLKVDPTTPPTFTVARCREPVRDQRLNVLVIGAGVQDTAALARKALKAFGAKTPSDIRSLGGLPRKEFDTPAFTKGGRLYGPLPPDADIDDIYRALRHISEALRGERSPYNEVVVVYFQGEALTKDGQHYLLTEESKGLKNYERAALTLTGLKKKLADAPGAQLLLLDLEYPARGGKDFTAALDFPRVGVFYYAWVRPAPPLEKDRLLDALGQALAKSADLGKAWQHLSQQARETRKLHPALLFGRDPPKEMAGLRLSH